MDSYRRAFKLDPDIDFAYKKHYQNTISKHHEAAAPATAKEDKFKHIVPIGNEYVAPSSSVSKDPLAHLIEEFSTQDTSYIPKLDYKPVSIAKLPGKTKNICCFNNTNNDQ